MGRKIFFSVCLSLCIVLFSGCNEKIRVAPDLEPTPDLALGNEWALITEPYVQFRVQPKANADSKAHARKGDIVQVVGKRFIQEGRQKVVWYQFESGWLSENSLKIFSNESKALTAAKSL